MSSIRIFILSSFAENGPMHGHALRLWAERKHVNLWTNISVGAVYGAMKRLASEGLLREVGREQEGNRPTRQIYEVTEEGHRALAALRREALSEIWFKYDPFDVALARSDPNSADSLPDILADRLDRVQALLEERKRTNEEASEYISLAQEWALKHSEYRLEAEVAYLTDLLAAAPALVDDARNPRPLKPKP